MKDRESRVNGYLKCNVSFADRFLYYFYNYNNIEEKNKIHFEIYLYLFNLKLVVQYI